MAGNAGLAQAILATKARVVDKPTSFVAKSSRARMRKQTNTPVPEGTAKPPGRPPKPEGFGPLRKVKRPDPTLPQTGIKPLTQPSPIPGAIIGPPASPLPSAPSSPAPQTQEQKVEAFMREAQKVAGPVNLETNLQKQIAEQQRHTAEAMKQQMTAFVLLKKELVSGSATKALTDQLTASHEKEMLRMVRDEERQRSTIVGLERHARDPEIGDKRHKPPTRLQSGPKPSKKKKKRATTSPQVQAGAKREDPAKRPGTGFDPRFFV